MLLFARQLPDPWLYILLFVTAVSLIVGKYTDGLFTASILALRQSASFRSAQHNAEALRSLVTHSARIKRSGETFEMPVGELVTEDRVLLESGDCVPADPCLSASQVLDIDESLLTPSAKLMRLAEAEITWPSPAHCYPGRQPPAY